MTNTFNHCITAERFLETFLQSLEVEGVKTTVFSKVNCLLSERFYVEDESDMLRYNCFSVGTLLYGAPIYSSTMSDRP